MEFLKSTAKLVLKMVLAVVAFSFLSMFILIGFVVLLKRGLPEGELSNLQIKTDHAVGVVELTGEILTSEKFEKSFKQVLDNDRIKAIVVRIDSPGGAVGASEEIYRVIKQGAAKKPVVCSLGSVAASGGLFAAVGCKKIIANESTLTGSIGVIMMTPNVHDLLERFGVEMNIVKGGRLKDTGSPFRDMTQEDRDYLQGVIDRTHQQFVRVVAEGRGLKVEDVKRFADGRIILGEEAKALGLIDDYGGPMEAARAALALAGDSGEPELIKTKEAGGFLSMLKEAQSSEVAYWLRSLGRSQLVFRAFF